MARTVHEKPPQLAVRRRLADRIWQWRKLTYAMSAALVLLVMAAIFLSITLPSAILPVSSEPTFFDANRAYRNMQDLARNYTDRTIGSPEAAGAAAWYEGALRDVAIKSTTKTFTTTLGHTTEQLRNVVVVLPGQTSDALLISAPRDDQLQPEAGSLAGASGTGILLDLVQVFAARPHEKTLIFVSSEGGSYGGLGLAHFLETDPLGADVKAVLSIQGLGREQRTELLGGVTGPRTTTPGWFVALAADTLHQAELGLRLPALPDQIATQSLKIAQGEQVAGLRDGIPSLRLYDEGQDIVTTTGLATQGAAVERLILSLDSGGNIPSAPPTALVLSSGRYLTARALNILGVLLLLPTAVMAAAWLIVTRLRPDAWLRYLRNLVSFVLPLALVVLGARLLALVGVLPRYPYQAPTASGTPATTPEVLLSALLLVVGIAVLFVCRHYLGYLKPSEPLIMAEMGKLSMGLLVLLAGLTLLAGHAPFSLLTGLTAAWIWPLATCFAEPRPVTAPWWPRARSNRRLLLFGLIAPVLLYAYLAVEIGMGWWSGWWFLLVQTVSGAYGVRGPAAGVLITSGFLILAGVRRLHLLPIETLDERDELSLIKTPPPRAWSPRPSRPRRSGGAGPL
jgi:hypothetical protein